MADLHFALLTGYARLCDQTGPLLAELEDHWAAQPPSAGHLSAFLFGHFDVLDIALHGTPEIFQRVPVPAARQPDWIAGALAPSMPQLENWVADSNSRRLEESPHPCVVSAEQLLGEAAGPDARFPLLGCCAVRLQGLGLLLREPSLRGGQGTIADLVGGFLAREYLEQHIPVEDPGADGPMQVAPLIGMTGRDLYLLVGCQTAEQGLQLSSALRATQVSLLCDALDSVIGNLHGLLEGPAESIPAADFSATKRQWRKTPVVRTTTTFVGLPLHRSAARAEDALFTVQRGRRPTVSFSAPGDPAAPAIRRGFVHSAYRMEAGSEGRGLEALQVELREHLGDVPNLLFTPVGLEQARAYRWPYERGMLRRAEADRQVRIDEVWTDIPPVPLRELHALTRRFGGAARVARLSEISVVRDWSEGDELQPLQPDLLDRLHRRFHAARGFHLGAGPGVPGSTGPPQGLLPRWDRASSDFVPTSLRLALRELVVTTINRMHEDLCGVAPLFGHVRALVRRVERLRRDAEEDSSGHRAGLGLTEPAGEGSGWSVPQLAPRDCQHLDEWRRLLCDALDDVRTSDGFASPVSAAHQALDVRATQRLALRGYATTLWAGLRAVGLDDVQALVTASSDQAMHCQCHPEDRVLHVQVPHHLLGRPADWQIPMWVGRALIEYTRVEVNLEVLVRGGPGPTTLQGPGTRVPDRPDATPPPTHSLAEVLVHVFELVGSLRVELLQEDHLHPSARTLRANLKQMEGVIKRLPEHLAAAAVARAQLGQAPASLAEAWWTTVARPRCRHRQVIHRARSGTPGPEDGVDELSADKALAIELAMMEVLLAGGADRGDGFLVRLVALLDEAHDHSSRLRLRTEPPPASLAARRLVRGMELALEGRVARPEHRSRAVLRSAGSFVRSVQSAAIDVTYRRMQAAYEEARKAWKPAHGPAPTPPSRPDSAAVAAHMVEQHPLLAHLETIGARIMQTCSTPTDGSEGKELVRHYRRTFFPRVDAAPTPGAPIEGGDGVGIDRLALEYCMSADELSGKRAYPPLCDFLAIKCLG